MTISERIFDILREKGISQKAFSEMTNIGQSTISDWKTKKTNPSADKILPVCRALGVSPEELLSGKTYYSKKDRSQEYYVISRDSQAGFLMESYDALSKDRQQQLIGYVQALREMEN